MKLSRKPRISRSSVVSQSSNQVVGKKAASHQRRAEVWVSSLMSQVRRSNRAWRVVLFFRCRVSEPADALPTVFRRKPLCPPQLLTSPSPLISFLIILSYDGKKTLSANLAGPNLEWWELTHLPYSCWQRDLSEGVVLLRTLQRTLRVANTGTAAPCENVDCRMIDGSYLWLPNPHPFSCLLHHFYPSLPASHAPVLRGFRLGGSERVINNA